MSFDSLSQIITIQKITQCAAVDLFFMQAGGDVLVSIGPINESGLPSAVWDEQRVAKAAIRVDGSATRVVWSVPVLVPANTQCAITVSSGDAETSLQVGQLGEQATAGGWVTAAQAAIGQMVHINPSGVATQYPKRMLKFDLLGVVYTEQTKTLKVGTVAVENATALLLNAGSNQPAGDARVSYAIQLLSQNGTVVQEMQADSGQPLALSAPHTGSAVVNATLRVGAGGLGAVLEPGTVLAVGSLLQSGTYITPAFQTGGGGDLRVIFEADIPGGAGVAVDMQINDAGQWIAVPWESSSPQTAGTIEMMHRKTGIAAQSLRLRLTLTGNTTARPKVRNLRAAVL